MSNLLKKIENDILMLSNRERAFLADRLLSSLDGEILTDNLIRHGLLKQKSGIKNTRKVKDQGSKHNLFLKRMINY